MKIQSLLNEEALLLESHMAQSRKILKESCDGLTSEQRAIVEGVYTELRPLIEASLTADQIKQLFGAVEQSAVASGSSRTAVGKGVDVAKKANEIINNIGKWLQDTTPVKMADQKFEKLKNDINKKFPDSKFLDGISNLGIWMKENPGKSAAIIGVLTAVASLAAGPVGGAIAGQVLRGASELIKGEKLSTAVGKGIKTAALGYLSGKAFEVLGKFVGGMRADSLPIPGAEDTGLATVNYGATKTLTGFGTEFKQTVQGFNVTVFPQEAEGINAAMNMIRNGEAGGFDTLKRIADEIRSPEYRSAIRDIVVNARKDQLANDGLLNWIKGLSQAGQALSQGAVAAAGEKKESYYLQDRPLSEGQVYLMFNKIEQRSVITEGPMDLVKKGVSAVAKGASWVGKQATEKITSAKLSAAWKEAGSPTDSDELAAFLEKQGVSTDIVKQVYGDMKIPAPGTAAAGSDIESVKQMIAKLPVDRRARLLTYLLGGAKAMKAAAN